MNPYRRFVFPALVDLVMSGDVFTRLRERVIRPTSGEILEVGFGTGLNARHYRRGARVTAIDPHPGMSRRAGRRIAAAEAEIRLVPIDGTRLPFPDGSFDGVVTTWTLCSIDRVSSALGEIRRVLRPGGKYFFVEHGASPEPRVRRWQDRLTPVQRRLGDGCRLNRDIAALVREAGFSGLEIEQFHLEGIPRVAGYTYLGSAGRGSDSTLDGEEVRPPEAMMR